MKTIRTTVTSNKKVETLGSLLGEAPKEFIAIKVKESKLINVKTIGELLS